ncbi:GPW/gp25 family protein [Wohlfahrtiimonas chitiniclastica]|uniref:GPW/gp25 family protein n=1 Tax=Wohlfahrtiimonas chitiniclastica TaxID=400946 RepID=UPI0007B697F5|nr:GPW/gp25 family protein [Wohlfahrtiimonas chitiniclastica]
MNRITGHEIPMNQHIQQSIIDIITTRIGSRVMRREYGSLLPELIDRPANDENMMQLMSATVIALSIWEPRITATFVNFTPVSNAGLVDLEIAATIKESGDQFYMNQRLLRNPDALNDFVKGASA